MGRRFEKKYLLKYMTYASNMKSFETNLRAKLCVIIQMSKSTRINFSIYNPRTE